MKTRNIYLLLSALLTLVMPAISNAQTLQDGDQKTGHFTDTQRVTWYTLNVTTEGEVTITARPVSNVRIDGLDIYAYVNGENKYRTNASSVDGVRTLICSDLGIGTYKIKVSGAPTGSATSGTYQISCSFVEPAIKSDPEPNNTWREASLINDGVAQQGRLGYDFYNSRDNVDWFCLVVKEDGKLTFETKSDQSLRLGNLTLYTLKADGTDVNYRTNKDMDGYNKDTTLVFEIPNVSAGTYYIKQDQYRGYGGYQLTYYFTSHSEEADPEPNDEWAKAIELKAGPSVTGQLGYDYQNSTDTKDWYRIEVPDEGAVTLTTSSETTLRLGHLTLYTLKADGSNVDYRTNKDMDGYNKDTTIVFTIVDCAPGSYYLRLEHYRGYGTYSIKYTFNANSYPKDPEPNNTWSDASEIAQGATIQGRLGYYYHNDTDAADWYKIVVPDEGTVRFTTSSETTLRLNHLTLYTLKADGTNVDYRTNKDMDGYNKDTTIVFSIVDCAPGTYYLRQDHYRGYGGYKLKYEFIPNAYGADAKENDTWDGATELTSGTTAQGRLGYFYHNDTDAADWYMFEVPADGQAVFTTNTETTLRLGHLTLYTLKADGTNVDYRTNKDMDGYEKDTTVIFTVSDLAPGIYYLRLDRYRGYGGYSFTYRFNKNPYWREKIDNDNFNGRVTLEKGKTVYTTLGYNYHSSTNSTDWYDLGTYHRDVIDVTICPDTTGTLNIGIVDWYKWDGTYNDNGTPHTTWLKGDRVERSRITTSYYNNTDDETHLILKVNRQSGYGGYSIVLGEDEEEMAAKGPLYAYYAGLHIIVGGRNTVRKGVACYNPITICNTSDWPTMPTALVLAATDDIHIIGFEMQSDIGKIYLPADSVLIEGEDCENTAVFIVPRLDPWQFYTFTLVSEGLGDINFIPIRPDEDPAERVRAFEPITASVVLAFVVDCAWDIVQDQLGIDHFISRTAGEVLALNEHEEQQYRKFLNLTYEQYHGEQPGVAAYTAKSVIKTACVKGIEKIPVIGSVIKAVGSAIEIMQNIVPNLRRRLWYWIYKDLGYIKDDLEVKDGKRAINGVVSSWDPNEMVGPQGVGDRHYIAGEQTISYTIMFENKAEAGDAAYRVRISDVLDEQVFDLSSVKFGPTSHDGVGYNWKMTRDGNHLSWDIEGIELPPNVNAPEGEGYVTFSVDLKPNLPDGTVIRNKAEIIFDKNYPIETNEYINTLDLTAPVTTMSRAKYDWTNHFIAIECNSYDAASGVDSYQLFVSKDGGDYTFEGQFPDLVFYNIPAGDGSTYSFYVLATDRVGNAEVVIPDALPYENTEGIRIIRPDDPSMMHRIYTIDGKYMGDDRSILPTGIYIQGGKKLIVK
ncbi:MAG: hypothetical protein J5543_01425 [Bacteroidales bacterium]|nr:hypothetical protein [Bacteroidales bacterium]